MPLEGDTILTKSRLNLSSWADKQQTRYCLFQVYLLVVFPVRAVSFYSRSMLRLIYNTCRKKTAYIFMEIGEDFNLNPLSLMFKAFPHDTLVFFEGCQPMLFRQAREFSLKLFVTATSAQELPPIKNP